MTIHTQPEANSMIENRLLIKEMQASRLLKTKANKPMAKLGGTKSLFAESNALTTFFKSRQVP